MDSLNKILNHFNFMVDFGYKQSFSNNIVQYCNNKIIIEILYNEYTFEIEACFMLINECKKIYLHDLLVYLGINKSGVYQISNKDKLDIGLNYISDLIKQVLNTIHDNDYEILSNAISFTDSNRNSKLLEIERKAAFDKAEVFWKNKKYKEVEKIYIKYANNLPDLYKKRLDYISKHCI